MAAAHPPPLSSPHNLARSGLFVLASESLALPAGFLVIVILTRALGPANYGLYALAAGIVIWIEWGLASLFTRPAIQLIAERREWPPVALALRRFHLIASVSAALALGLLAGPVAALFGEPAFAAYLRLYALEIPLFTLAIFYKNLLVGTAAFNRRAVVSICRHLSRPMLVWAFVAAGFSITGAIVGNIVASAVELACGRLIGRIPGRHRPASIRSQFWRFAVPLFTFGICMRLFDKLDLLMLKTLGGTPETVGNYGAAAAAAVAAGILSIALTPMLLSVMTRALRDGEIERTRRIAGLSLRGILNLAAFAAVGAAAAPEIAGLLFGPGYAAAGPILGVLLFAALAMVYIAFAASIFTSVGRPAWATGLAVPMLLLAGAGHLALIPRLGAPGAAGVTVGVAVLGAAAATLLVRRAFDVAPPPIAFIRSAAAAGIGFAVSALWPAAGVWIPVKLAAGCGLVAVALIALGEWGQAEWVIVRSLIAPRRGGGAAPAGA
jgi:O-antigen/teichoic acid export membrane protein